MTHSSSETTANSGSPPPISPFSTFSQNSDATSDESPDLGAFNTIFRALGHLQPPIRSLNPHLHVTVDLPTVTTTTPISSIPPSESVTDGDNGSTVWSHLPIMSYLASHSSHSGNSHSNTSNSHSTIGPHSVEPSRTEDGEETEGELPPRTLTTESRSEVSDSTPASISVSAPTSVSPNPLIRRTYPIPNVISDPDEVYSDPEQPSLGILDGAFTFIAAERARIAAAREVDNRHASTHAHTILLTTGRQQPNYSSTSDSTWRHVVEPRRGRKRRRKKTKATSVPPQIVIIRREGEAEISTEATVMPLNRGADGDGEDEEDEVSSSSENRRANLKHTPSTPPHTRRPQPSSSNANSTSTRLKHSRSTPVLRFPTTIPPDPQILRLRCLAHKLRLKFPEDYDRITALLTQDFSGSGGDSDFSDPRGPVPGGRDTLIHVFVDHSNILIGLLTYLKRHHNHRSSNPSFRASKQKRMSHAALALLLERGRPITRRCLVTSSPLYQPMESAEQLGYEVKVFARVPDQGNGQDRLGKGSTGRRIGGDGAASMNNSWRSGHGHARNVSGGGNGTTSTDSDIPLTTRPGNSHSNSAPAMRVRYREQGVDELLQLKLHQAIAAVDVPPPNATIVLATGDGNVGQFSDEGFLGPVRTALRKGWRVELYAWEEGLSRAWKREFGGNEGATNWGPGGSGNGEGGYGDRFRIIRMEDFGEDLVEVEGEY
ncbi:hypothetical protein BJ138DRAFT_650720 [Hygrophoropsis aurantiaca]|uniref:Uncharacterized protein n=1 Tax=Hygrophoropsis aurantiaca TaxID=72124 RepID=A0ACB7ZYW3_9AGAM|nr:hypothetical protein BJ138DRAFT_650720 [Hygrophoropsis aurantiaca]